MEGEHSKILGNIGGYEIGAKWHWKIKTHKISVYLLAASVVSMLVTALCCSFFWIHLTNLVNKQAELAEITSGILKLQNEVQFELEEIKRIKEEMKFYESDEDTIDDDQSIRGKRSTLQGSLLASSSSNKSKDSKYKMKKNSTTDKTFKRYSKQPSHVTAAHMEMDTIFYNTRSDGLITRWRPQSGASAIVDRIQLENHNSTLVVPSTGLYFIYAQLCYAATKENNSFEVRLINQGASTNSESKVIAQCKTATTILGNEVTCYTSVAQVLQEGSKIYLQQVEKNRHLFMNLGRSFMGIVKMSN